MKLKKGVDQSDIKHQTWYVIGFVDALSRALDLGEAIVTSLRDGSHSVNSLHYKGLAVDFRTKHLDEANIGALVTGLKVYLDPHGYDVILEGDHIHVEFDPKAGEKFYLEA